MSRSDDISAVRLAYRQAKIAEQSRSAIEQQMKAYRRSYGEDAAETLDAMEVEMAPVVAWFDARRKEHRKVAEKIVTPMDEWQRIVHVRGFGIWGMVALIGEAGDICDYSGCRKLYKRLGLAPDDAYPTGEKKKGRKIPRFTRGRIMGIIADPLLRAQWRGEKEGVPAHPIGPYGAVYGITKARRLAEDKTKGHAERLARRTMVKALLHDVHAAWHGNNLLHAVEMAAD